LTLWLLGYPEQALKRSQEALTLARELAHPFSLAVALCLAAWLHQCRREGQRTHEQAEAAITLCTDQGFAFFLAWATILRGWALAEQGQEKDGIAQIHQGLADYRATGAESSTPHYLALLAETYGRDGQAGEGLTVVGEALAIVDKNEERYYEAELYRLKGELLLQKFGVRGSESQEVQQKSKGKGQKAKVETSPQAEAEACFLKAIEIAQKQQAKSLELRAVMSLVRLRQHQAAQHATRDTHHETRAKLDAAHTMLADIYNWFTEGFNTKDLQEAKALLDIPIY
jgi:predicted ATPase